MLPLAWEPRSFRNGRLSLPSSSSTRRCRRRASHLRLHRTSGVRRAPDVLSWARELHATAGVRLVTLSRAGSDFRLRIAHEQPDVCCTFLALQNHGGAYPSRRTFDAATSSGGRLHGGCVVLLRGSCAMLPFAAPTRISRPCAARCRLVYSTA